MGEVFASAPFIVGKSEPSPTEVVCVRTFEVNGRRELRRVCIEGPVFDLQEAVGW